MSPPLTAGGAWAAEETAEQRDQRMQWWREARFGMFIHWGLYSVPAGTWEKQKFNGGVEWLQSYAGMPAEQYKKAFFQKFKAENYRPREWARLAKKAGMKYIVLTAKHHEGFCLWNSKSTPFNAVNSGAGRDLLKEFVEACRAEKLKVGLYFSLIDWHQPHFPVRNTGLPHPLAAQPGDHDRQRQAEKYVKLMHRQVTELLTEYGRIDLLWFDYSSRQWQGEKWRAGELLQKIRKLQPQIIINNRLYAKFKHPEDAHRSYGDFSTPEQFIPAAAIRVSTGNPDMTMNNSWGYSSHDHNWKSGRELIRNLIDISSKGGNYLLNVGPKADGSLPGPTITRLQEIGKWMHLNGDAIYGTQASPFGKTPFGHVTAAEGIFYLHLLKPPFNGRIFLPLNTATVASARLLSGGRQLKVTQDRNGLTVETRKIAPFQVIELKAGGTILKGIHPEKDGTFKLPADRAELHGEKLRLEPDGNIGYWLNTSEHVSWKLKSLKSRNYQIIIEYALSEKAAGSEIAISSGDSRLTFIPQSTMDWRTYRTVPAGFLHPADGDALLEIHAVKKPGEAVINIKAIQLIPQP